MLGSEVLRPISAGAMRLHLFFFAVSTTSSAHPDCVMSVEDVVLESALSEDGSQWALVCDGWHRLAFISRPPVCMLLVDKVSQRVIRQSAEDVRLSLTLPLHALQSYSEEQQLLVRARYIYSCVMLIIHDLRR